MCINEKGYGNYELIPYTNDPFVKCYIHVDENGIISSVHSPAGGSARDGYLPSYIVGKKFKDYKTIYVEDHGQVARTFHKI